MKVSFGHWSVQVQAASSCSLGDSADGWQPHPPRRRLPQPRDFRGCEDLQSFQKASKGRIPRSIHGVDDADSSLRLVRAERFFGSADAALAPIGS